MIRRKQTSGSRRWAGGFTLIEVMASVALLAFLLGGILVAYRRTADRVTEEYLRDRGVAVAQRQMERLLASAQEPDAAELHGQDEEDPLFQWKMELKRVAVGTEPPREDLTNTLIEARVVVECDLPDSDSQWESATDTQMETEMETEGTGKTVAELVRYIAALKPVAGHALAVPMTPREAEFPAWYQKLEETGQATNLDAVLQAMFQAGELPPEMLNAPQTPPGTDAPTP